ncbi:hypothetical protein NEF87_001096 [Candidatus Lokiarchaeum ossiferum]|uniref:Fibronectin type-III domain-containing protein n=1 Tax=Candidatus Lokiarchaeum ossiferum TaxID=2951803 RepID=A0ABY6HN08_9ARCH|nr:hypothetical protein NEF87_001096 [Candidatus Lokiarchaeum sp. B-35]
MKTKQVIYFIILVNLFGLIISFSESETTNKLEKQQIFDSAEPIDDNFYTPPQNLTASGEIGYVQLNWTASEFGVNINVESYNIYRSITNDSSFTFITSLSSMELSYQDFTGDPGIEYFYFVTAGIVIIDPSWEEQESESSNIVSAVSLAMLPPQNLTASGEIGYVQLNWTAPSGASAFPQSSYNIYRSLTNDSIFTFIDSAYNWELSYQDNDVVCGTEYFYYVSIFTFQESNQSNIVSAIPIGVPSLPSNLQATPGNESVALHWESPILNNGSTILWYNIYRTTNVGGSFSYQFNTSSMNAIDVNLTNGHEYYYKVSAASIAGESEFSNNASAIPVNQSTVPTAPLNPSISTGKDYLDADDYIQLTWDKPVSNGGALINEYRIYRSEDNESFSYIGYNTMLRYFDIEIENGTTYYYYITAVNSIGESNTSSIAESNNTSVLNKATPPENITAKAGLGFVFLEWDAPLSNGSSSWGLTYFYIYRSTRSTTGFPEYFLGLSYYDEFYYNDTSVENGTTYYYYVTTYNDYDESLGSSIVNATPYASYGPSSPQNLQATPSNCTVGLQWEVPTLSGASIIKYYEIYRSTNNTTAYTQIGTSFSEEYNDTTVTNNITYYYYVVAVNNYAASPQSNEVSAIFVIIAPSAPQNLQTTPSNCTIELQWDAPALTGTGPIIHYEIYRSTNDTTSYTQIGTSFSEEYNDTTVTNNITYYYYVVAVNNYAVGPQSNEVSGIPALFATVPSKPLNLQAITNIVEVQLYWNISSTNGGEPIFNYTVYRSTTNGTDYIAIVNTNTTSYIDENVTQGYIYFYVVKAINIIGESEKSNQVSARLKETPSAPTGLRIESNFADGVPYNILEWNAPLSNGSAPILYYNIYRANNTAEYSSDENIPYEIIGTSTITQFTDDGDLVPHMNYYYKIVAVNIYGESIGISDTFHIEEDSSPLGPIDLLLVLIGVVGASIIYKKKRK